MPNPNRTCQECDGPMPPRKARTGSEPKFCSAQCRQRFNNRRMTRGAMLYDLFMPARYNRKVSAGNITTMAQIANVWREIDAIDLDGRVSWSDPINEDHADPFTEACDQLRKALEKAKAVDTPRELCA